MHSVCAGHKSALDKKKDGCGTLKIFVEGDAVEYLEINEAARAGRMDGFVVEYKAVFKHCAAEVIPMGQVFSQFRRRKDVAGAGSVKKQSLHTDTHPRAKAIEPEQKHGQH